MSAKLILVVSVGRLQLGATLLGLVLGCRGPSHEKPPNVVYIQSDTHRWGAMSFTQTPQVQTPHMDELKKRGVSLNRYYVNLPICTPYRALMMTGRWPYQQGLIANHMKLAERVDMLVGKQTWGTISWTFKNAGYRTGHFGKWHLGGDDARPFGFDRSIIWKQTNNHRKNPYIVDGGDPRIWSGESNATATTDQALAWIAEVSEGPEPFFVVISLNPPHGPFHDAPESKKALYPSEKELLFHPLDQTRDFEQHRDYHALISGVDDDLGTVMQRLDELGIAENTILIYTSDHGAMTGIDGVAYGQKRHPNDESARVPFLIRWPGHIPEDVDIEAPTSTIDVFPTLASLASLDDRLDTAGTPDAAESSEYVASLPGTDLAPLLRGELNAPKPGPVYLAHPSNMNNRGSRHEIIWRAVVTPEFTYSTTDQGEHRLWKNSAGYQSENLLDNPAFLETRLKLWRQLDELMDEVERRYYDNWFERMSESEVRAWNAEHGFGDNPDRQIGRAAVFDLSKSRPPAAK